ncbi:YHS domain-containing (seleno)protein [Flaviramulus aquimarinus]|uniref:YHS domain-containing (Seleno)protein n=1 Tax=Flaviramulus aquimarinus TaxID=1170456 RepID=A0ABP9EZ51_9FLAO
MKSLILLFTLIVSSTYAQTLDYNTKKGFAINGYDLVAYFNGEAIEGDKAFIAKFDSINYKFSSEENLSLFNKNPKKYIPQYGGYCAYALAIKNTKVSVNPKTFQIKDGKLYLFYNAWGTNTLELWNEQDALSLQKKADNNWEAIKFKK